LGEGKGFWDGEGILGLGMRRKAVGLWNKWKEDVPVKEEIPVTTTTAETTIITEPPALIDNTGCGSRDRVSTSLESRIQQQEHE
jgi:hypothetical protein